MNKLLAESIGVFILTTAIGLSTSPISAGIVLIALIYIGTHLTDAHFNPAVSFSAWICGKIELHEFTEYVSGQVIGAIFGAGFVWWISKMTFAPTPARTTSPFVFIALELLLSFLFILLFLCMMYPAKRRRNPVFGIVIGIGLTGCYLIADPIIGMGLNPGTTGGFILMDYFNNGGSYQYYPVYLLAPCISAIGAAYAHKYLMEFRTDILR